MSELSNEDKQKKQELLEKIQQEKQKQKKWSERREEIYNQLYPTDRIDGKIKQLEGKIFLKEKIVEDKGKKVRKSEEDRVEAQILENKKRITESSVSKVQELRNQLAIEKDKQKEEKEKLQKLEEKYLLPTEKPRGFLASIISQIERFKNRKHIAMAKQQTKIDIEVTRDIVNVLARKVDDLEKKLKHEEEMAQSYQKDYEEQKAKSKEKITSKKEKMQNQIEEEKQEIERLKQEKQKLEEEREKLKAKQKDISKAEREKLKEEQRKANKAAQAAGKEIRELQAQVKEIDPEHYVDDTFSQLFNNPFYKTFYGQGNETQSQPTISKEENKQIKKVDSKCAEFRKGYEIDNRDNGIEKNAMIAIQANEEENFETKENYEKG